ncbi:MAG: Sir2 family NAD-dependent protein deacetylase [Polyangiales bacterium]
MTDDLRLGTARLLDGDVPGACAALARAVTIAPHDPSARHNHAVALRLAGDLARAREEADAALVLGAVGAPPLAHAGLLALLAGDVPSAVARYRQALAADPSHAVSHAYLGHALRLRGDHAGAVLCFERALAPGATPLPAIVRERVEAQLHDARRAPARTERVRPTACSAPAVTELIDAATGAVPAVAVETSSLAPGASRAVDVDEAAALLQRSRRVVALTGAGLSVASGLHTRKDLWRVFDRDAAVSAVGFRAAPTALWSVVRAFLGRAEHAPNAAHSALAALPRLAGVVTQNVDGLHQRADPGAAYPVVELHGTLEATRCHDCGADAGAPASSFVGEGATLPPVCSRCGGPLRPDVVLFGEPVARERLAAAEALVRGCDLLLVAGCAMDVTPACELPRLAAKAGAAVLELKRGPSRIADAVGALHLAGAAEDTLPALYDAVARREGLPARAFGATRQVPALLPTAAPVTMPHVSEAPQEWTVVEWLKRPGDVVLPDELVVRAEGDKACVDIPAERAGVFRRALVAVETVAPFDAPLYEIDPLPEDDARRLREAQRTSVRQESARAEPYGPHSARVEAFLAAIREAPWLSPDASLAVRDEAAMRWLQERLDEHAAALARVDPALLEGAALRVWVTDDAAAAHARWAAAWREESASRGAARHRFVGEGPWTRALVTAERWLDARRNPSTAAWSSRAREAATAAVEAALRERHGAEAFFDRLAAAPRALVGAAVERLVCARGDDPPCPWRPLVEVWLLGAWPFAVGDGELGVYVPVVAGGVIVASTGAPSLRLYGARLHVVGADAGGVGRLADAPGTMTPEDAARRGGRRS